MRANNLIFIASRVSLALCAAVACALSQSKDPLPDEWYLTTEDSAASLYVVELGQGDKVVVLHGGWGSEHSYLFDAVKGLEDRYRSVFYDQRGSLRSPCPDSMISIPKHVEDLEQLRKELGIPKLTILGHSMGTLLALLYLEKYPSNVKGLVLMSALPLKVDNVQTAFDEFNQNAQSLMQRPEAQEEVKKHGLDRELLTQKEKTYKWRIQFTSANVYHVNRWRQMRGGNVFYSGRAARAAVRSLPVSWDFRTNLRSHPYPVYFINGDHDYTDPSCRRNAELLG